MQFVKPAFGRVKVGGGGGGQASNLSCIPYGTPLTNASIT